MNILSTPISNIRRKRAWKARMRGDRARDQQSWAEAREAYTAYLKEMPADFDIWVQLGHSAKEFGNLDAADAAYQSAYMINPNNADLHLQIGHLRKMQNRMGDARIAYEMSFSIDGNRDAATELAAMVAPAESDDHRGDLHDVIDVIGPEFDIDYYLGQLADKKPIDAPIYHYITVGVSLGLNPSRSFSTSFYLEQNPDVRESNVNPFYHYLRAGHLEGRPGKPGPNLTTAYNADLDVMAAHFDAAFYKRQHPDVARCGADPLKYFFYTGWELGHDPSPDFSTSFYLQRYPDARDHGNPLLHFIRHGRARGRLPKVPDAIPAAEQDRLTGDTPFLRSLITPDFDAGFYSQAYQDIRANGLDPLEHFLLHGAEEGRDPNAWFSTRFYTDTYPDVRISAINPFAHYLIWGRQEHFRTSPAQKAQPSHLAKHAHLIKDGDLGALRLAPQPALTTPRTAKDGALRIHWVVPDFNAGGGGHMTIFRMVRWLEQFGHSCRIWVYNPISRRTKAEREAILLRHYQVVSAEVFIADENADFSDADCLVATGWDTAYYVKAAKTAAERYYFVQDYEPSFYPVGSRNLAAKGTYELGLACICASPWLKKLMIEDHGAWARAFDLCADESYLAPTERRSNAVPRIAFYAREHTVRRAVELALIGLELLAESGLTFHVDFFGTEHVFGETPFSATNWGVLSPGALSEVYGEADVGLCFSATNYSLVPQEMMACGLPLVELDGESTRAIFPEGVVALAGPDPASIAATLRRLLQDPAARDQQRARASEWLQQFSWERSARAVESALRERLGFTAALPAPGPSPIKASVVIPAYNGGALLKRVVEAVLRQQAPWDFELIVIDSSSSDGSIDAIRHLDDRVRIRQIDKSTFQHGRTRNLGIEMARGEYVAFLTQDALPVDQFWLYNFVVLLDRYPQAAGAFGRHIAWPEANAFTKRDIDAHFRNFQRYPICMSIYTDIDAHRRRDMSFRGILHYYSDNSSCMRKSVWERIPYPEIDYGEDQLWADQVTAAGYAKVYSEHSVVFHSHDYDEIEQFKRARTEANFFRNCFGYDLAPGDLPGDIARTNTEDERWGVRNGVATDVIARQKELNIHRFTGLAAGAVEGIVFKSPF